MDSRLAKGQSAIDFRVSDTYSNVFTLKSFYGKKLLISLQRGVMCPFCNLRIHELSKRCLFYRSRGLEIILISESTRSTILESSFFPNIELTIIPDPERELYKLYKVELSYLKTGASFLTPENVGVLWNANKNGMPIKTEEGTSIHRIPAEFLVDEKGNIYEAHYGKSIADSISSFTIETFLTQSLPEEVVL